MTFHFRFLFQFCIFDPECPKNLPSCGGLKVEVWTDNSLHSASVGSNPAWVKDFSGVFNLVGKF